MPLYVVISKDEKHHGLRHPRTDHFTSVDAMKHYYCLKNKPYIELYVKKFLQRYKGENSSYQLWYKTFHCFACAPSYSLLILT